LKSGIPRLLEIVISVVALAAFAPVILLAAAAIALTSRGSVIFRQQRVGQGGRTFTLYKLRTMRSSSSGPQVTSGSDQRITRIGRLLRKSKIDELPEFWNVIKGDLSLVGPRAEVPKYVNLTNPDWAFVLRSKPGITDPVTARLRNEEELLRNVEGSLELFYLNVLQPLKLRGYRDYLNARSCWTDFKVIWNTGVAILRPGKVPHLTLKDLIANDSLLDSVELNSSP
jgi:lipopolysaccharide/colanic/teichoic acid biosynthesis glycosyltransferase